MRPLKRPRCSWEDNIKLGPKEIGCEGMEWIQLAHNMGHIVGSCEHDNQPLDSITCS
jgi:hypothetical protein